MLGWRPLAAFLLVVGIVLSPFRAVAATIPTLIAHDLAAWDKDLQTRATAQGAREKVTERVL